MVNRNPESKLGTLNSVQIAGLAVLLSALAAGSVTFLLRRFVFRPVIDRRRAVPLSGVQPAVNAASPTTASSHFSEDIVLPGITATGTEIAEHNSETGRSPEGV